MNLLSFFQRRGRERALKLYGEARDLVDSGLYEDALKVARKLRKLRYSGAFEIEGLAYSGLERNEDAVRVLREGLALAPTVWLNWQLLGSCLSNLGRYDEALLAYDRAQACSGSDPASIDLNRAIIEIRRKDYLSAIRHVDSIHGFASAGMRLRAIEVRVDALHFLGRDVEAEDLGTRTLNEWRDSNVREAERSVGGIALTVGRIRLARVDDRSSIRPFAIEWWRATGHEPLLWLIREATIMRSLSTHYFRLTLCGKIDPEQRSHYDDSEGYWRSVGVMADSAEEAFALFMEIAEPEIGVKVTLDEAKSDDEDEDVKGVYFVSGRVFYNEMR